jgi:hypothetical protein
MPQVTIFLEGGGDQRFEPWRNERVEVRNALRRTVEDGIEDDGVRAAAEGLDASRHLVEHDA